jgi:hypothetical protein
MSGTAGQGVGGLVLHGGEDVAVGVEGDGDGGVAEAFALEGRVGQATAKEAVRLAKILDERMKDQ